MPMVVLDALPRGLVTKLRASAGIQILEGERSVLNISDSPQAIALYKEFLSDGDGGNADPMVTPVFGVLPFQSRAVEAEVWSLLQTFEPMMTADFSPGAAPLQLVPAVHVPLGGVLYHHSKIALQAVQDEITSLHRFAAACPALAAVPSGQIICDLVIQYAHNNIVQRLRKA